MTPLSGKERSRRVPLDYYRLPARWWKLWLCVIFLLMPFLVWAGFMVFDGRWGARPSSPGPIHSVHATWADQCSVCHAGVTSPTGSRNVINVWGGAGPVADQLCKKCHEGAEHHSAIAEHAKLHCADCHRDHRGTDTSLVRMRDSVCTRCHENLAAKRRDDAPELAFANKVTLFATDAHPDFKVLSRTGDAAEPTPQPREQWRDPARLKFNHALHLRPGQKHTEPQTRAWLLKDVKAIDPKLHARYQAEQANQDDNSPVELTCASCHRLDMTDVTSNAGMTRGASGAYMLPVTYENDCRGCHPLSFDKRVPQDEARPRRQVPHHLQPTEVHQFLWGVYATEEINREFKDQKPPVAFPLPGKTRKLIDQATAKTDEFLFQDDVDTTERYLYSGQTTCGLCHQHEPNPGSLVPMAIKLPQVPEVWFAHAKFDHRAHRAVLCQECHKGVEAEEKRVQVLLPVMADCVTCHSPARNEQGHRHGGARFDCVECHRYHGGDEPLHNIGNKGGAPKEKRSGAPFREGS